MTNTLVFSTGCHAGYNLVDGDSVPGVTQALDWAQAMSRKGATLVAGTSYQYGDDELIEYSERIYTELSHQLRVGTGPVAVGDARPRQLAYLAATPEIKGMHEKALLTSAVFGLPMFAVQHARLPAIRQPAAAPPSARSTASIPGNQIGELDLTATS